MLMSQWQENSPAINNPKLDFIQTWGLISLVNDNHVDNFLKEILVYVLLWLDCKQSTQKFVPKLLSHSLIISVLG